jgi:hypothetical protein
MEAACHHGCNTPSTSALSGGGTQTFAGRFLNTATVVPEDEKGSDLGKGE